MQVMGVINEGLKLRATHETKMNQVRKTVPPEIQVHPCGAGERGLTRLSLSPAPG